MQPRSESPQAVRAPQQFMHRPLVAMFDEDPSPRGQDTDTLSGDALNCGDLTSDQKPVTVNEIGVDPYRLDRDGDGRGCTS